MPSNYIPIESEYVLDPSNELNKSLITKPGLLFIYVHNVTYMYKLLFIIQETFAILLR